MTKHEFATPLPEVQYLPAIFRRVESGEIRIPAFQRDFVWSEPQVLRLLESVYYGYPIGSLLFWSVQERELEIGHVRPFPDLPEKYPISFVLDGMQRLSSLYGVFHWTSQNEANEFNVIFDLKNESFLHYNPKELPEAYIHLSALFIPKMLLENQKNLSSRTDGDELIDRSIKLHSTFQEYLVPTVTIKGRSVSEVVQIFERVNTTGLRLSAVDFMRAMTWSGEFDLANEVSLIQAALEPTGYFFPTETMVKALAVVLDKAPTPTEMLKLRQVSPETLHQGMEKVKEVLSCVVDFLKTNFRILSYDFVPYEGQVLVLTKLFALTLHPSSNVLDSIRKWFWTIGISEVLRGKPDSYVVRVINSIDKLVQGDSGALEYREDLNPTDLLTRRFIKGKALSSTLASMFAVHGARSLVSGELVDPEDFMSEFLSENFLGLYSLEALPAESRLYAASSNKVFANIVVASKKDRSIVGKTEPLVLVEQLFERFGPEAQEILDSQFISSVAVQAMKTQDVDGFLYNRAHRMFGYAVDLVRDISNHSDEGPQDPSRL